MCRGKWSDLVVHPPPFGRDAYPEEAEIAAMDAKTGASLKVRILCHSFAFPADYSCFVNSANVELHGLLLIDIYMFLDKCFKCQINVLIRVAVSAYISADNPDVFP